MAEFQRFYRVYCDRVAGKGQSSDDHVIVFRENIIPDIATLSGVDF